MECQVRHKGAIASFACFLLLPYIYNLRLWIKHELLQIRSSIVTVHLIATIVGKLDQNSQQIGKKMLYHNTQQYYHSTTVITVYVIMLQVGLTIATLLMAPESVI